MQCGRTLASIYAVSKGRVKLSFDCLKSQQFKKSGWPKDVLNYIESIYRYKKERQTGSEKTRSISCPCFNLRCIAIDAPREQKTKHRTDGKSVPAALIRYPNRVVWSKVLCEKMDYFLFSSTTLSGESVKLLKIPILSETTPK